MHIILLNTAYVQPV